MVNSKFWSDTWVVDKLNALDRYLFLYLLTNERRNIIGVYELPMRTAAFETGIDQNDLLKMMDRLAPKIEYVQGWVYIRNAADHQADNPNINKGMAREVAALPAAIRDEIRVIGVGSLRLAHAFDAFDEAVETAAALQALERNTEVTRSDMKPLQATRSHLKPLEVTPSDMPVARDTKPNLTKPNLTNKESSPAGKPLDPNIQINKEIQEIFSFYVKSFNAENSHIKLSTQRKQKIRARLQDAGKEMLFLAITNTAASPFHRGDNDRGWKANIDFIVRSYEQVEKLAAMNEETMIAGADNRAPTEEEMKKAMERL